MADLAPFPVFDDDRGRLIPVEFDTLPFRPERCFVVAALGRPASRGGHLAQCREVVLLLRGAVTLRLTNADRVTQHRLSEPGASALIDPSDFVDYQLETPNTEILVLADQPYPGRPE